MTLLLLSCAGRALPSRPLPEPPAEPAPLVVAWQAHLDRDNPLVGGIYATEAQAFVSEEALLAALAEAPQVLVGERHDHPDHHLVQARVVSGLAREGSAVVFEMLDAEDPTDALSAKELADAVDWEDSGWPDFSLYEPVFTALFAQGAHPVAGHPTEEQLRAVMGEGYEVLGEALEGLELAPLPEAALASLEAQIVASHCGHAPPELVAMMVRAQRLKDAWMARALEQSGGPAVLIAGNGHVRKDWGVPQALEGSLTVMPMEVETGLLAPTDYPVELADFVVFTPRLDDDDPCERFREQLERMGEDEG